MDHTQTIDTQAVERYLLGELPEAEAEDFERHYFECPECALAVESGQVLIENAREVFKEDDRLPARHASPESSKRFWDVFAEAWKRPAFALPWAAAALFGVIALYQGAVLYPRRAPVEMAQAPPAFQLDGAVRGEGSHVAVPAGTQALSLLADVPSDSKFPKYLCVLTTEGRTVFSVTAAAPAPGLPLNLMVSVKDWKPGDFELTIYDVQPDGRQGDKVAVNPFDFKFN